MTMEQNKERVSRRRLVGRAATASAAAGLAAGAFGAGIASATAAPISPQAAVSARYTASVAATVVRAHHSATSPGAMSIGVRASVFGPQFTKRGMVLVLEPIEFGTTEQVNRAIAESLRQRVSDLLAQQGQVVTPEEVAVQVFGGSL